MDQWTNSRNLRVMFMLINYCQKETDVNYSLGSASWLNHKNFQSMPHDIIFSRQIAET